VKALLPIFLTVFIWQFSFCIFSFSQSNLVENGNFENYTSCPTSVNQINYAVPWFNPTQGTSDYYNACFTVGGFSVDVPQNWIGFQNARTGMGYSGIAVFPAQNPPSYREYIEVKLSDSLQSGTKYYVSFYVSLADSVRYATDAIGAYFSNDSIYSNNDINLSYTPQITNPDGNMLTNKTDWIQVFGEFISQGGEQFMTIGNFKDDLNTDTIFVAGGGNPILFLNSIYYYIDDVCISDNPDTCNVQTSIEENRLHNDAIILYPNPVKNKLYIQTKLKTGFTCSVFNVFGASVITTNNKFYKEAEIDLEGLSTGIYYVRVSFGTEFITRKIIVANKN